MIQIIVQALMLFLLFSLPLQAAEQDAIPIALIDLDYRDTSGEPTDQRAVHETRLRVFMDALRDDLTREGLFRVVTPKCEPAPCSVASMDAQSVLNAARAAGARLVLFGEIHKMSTLVQFANVQVVEVEHDELVARHSMSFRGDDDQSWLRAGNFLVKQLNEELPAWREKRAGAR